MNKTIKRLGGIITAMIFVFSFFGIQNAEAAITNQLDFGSSGSDVAELQTYLATNVDIYPSGLVTGHFDYLTQSATKKFQVARGIVSAGTPETTGYGRVGPQTMAKLNALIYFNEQEQANFGLAVRIKIPKINVNSAIEPVSLTLDGAMDTPKSPGNVAWFEFGPLPGETGSAVIAGHYGWKDGKVAVFDNLYKLQKGDKLFMENEKGATITFVVREIRMYNSKADASDIFVSNDGKSHLNLITCNGVWDETEKSYSNRLVVFTDKE